MPLPERYAQEVPDVTAIWEPEGYFSAQASIWLAQCQARNELYGAPTSEQLSQIEQALVLSPDDIADLIHAQGHETNTLLRRVQGRLSPEAGNFIHMGNTSSDVLDTSLSLQMRESIDIVRQDFSALAGSLKTLAIQHQDTLQIGRSHGQHGTPQTFGRQVLGWYAEVMRDIERMDRSSEVISVGKLSGEFGTNVFIEPELEENTLRRLGLKPDPAPTQVISRDRHAEVIAHMAISGTTLARIATNIRLLAITEIGEVREPFDSATQQGSSAMPHKRNPEKAERIVGLSRRIGSGFGEELDNMLLWFERDMSHSSTERYTFPDIFGSLAYSARLTKEIIDGLVVNPQRMQENINSTYGAIYSSQILNALLETGKMSRTETYELIKPLAQQAMDTRVQLRELVGQNAKITQLLDSATLDELFDPAFFMRNIYTAYRRLDIKP